MMPDWFERDFLESLDTYGLCANLPDKLLAITPQLSGLPVCMACTNGRTRSAVFLVTGGIGHAFWAILQPVVSTFGRPLGLAFACGVNRHPVSTVRDLVSFSKVRPIKTLFVREIEPYRRVSAT
jgi:hypothetical protein